MKYRYRLWREWNPSTGKKPILFIMLNPSTADERVLDPTVRRCLGYAMSWGFGKMEVCNIFALRSTDPKELYSVKDPVGEGNDEAIQQAAIDAEMVIAAWGIHGLYRNRSNEIPKIVCELAGKPLFCLTTTKKGGQPGHPLYLKADLKPILWRDIIDN
jgi:hypothetical protein